MMLAETISMKQLRLLILGIGLLLTVPGFAQQANIWLTDLNGDDTLSVLVGDEVEFLVWIDTYGQEITGFQCFMTFPEELIEPVRYTEDLDGWFFDNAIFGEGNGVVVFADDHDSRPGMDPLPDNQLDWCYQTPFGNPRPTFPAYGFACTFKLRFLAPTEYHTVLFDHDNGHFRNTLYWAGQSAEELPFNNEYPLVIDVRGMQLGPLPDVYLTTPAPCDSLNLYDFVEQLEGVEDSSYVFSWNELDPNNVCSIDSQRTADAFWLRLCGTGPGRRLELEVVAEAIGLEARDTLTVFRGDPPVIADTVAAAYPFVSWLEDSSAVVDFGDYASDLDDPPDSLTWSVLAPGDTVGLEFDSLGRTGTFSSPADWYGMDLLWLLVQDPGGMADTSSLATETLPVNDPPGILFEGQVEVHPGLPTQIDLEEVSWDVDDDYEALTWSSESDTSLVALRIDPVTHLLLLEVQEDTELWTEAAFLVLVEDAAGEEDQDSLFVLVSSYPPIWSPMGDVVFQSHQEVTRDLNNFVEDLDDADELLDIWVEGNAEIQIYIDPLTHVATFSAESTWRGSERAVFFARDPGGNSDSDTVTVVALLGGNPVVAHIPDLVLLPGETDSSIVLDQHVWDLDTPPEEMNWEVFHNDLFSVGVNETTHRVTVTAPFIPGSSDMAIYRASDPQGHQDEDPGALVVIDPSGNPVVLPAAEIWMSTSEVDSSVHLDELVYDYDHDQDEMSWTVSQGVLVSTWVRPEDRVLLITSSWDSGEETLSLEVEDPETNTAAGTLVVHVSEGNPPVVSEFAPRYVIAGGNDTLHEMSNWVYDEDAGDLIDWSFIDPPDSPVYAMYYPAEDMGVIYTDSSHVAVDLIGAVAEDRETNTDLAWIEVHSLENEAPGIEAGVLPNTAVPELLDLVVLSDEALRELEAHRASDGAPVDFEELPVGEPELALFRAHYVLQGGEEVIMLRAVDLPGYPQVEGNETLDSLVLSSGVLGGPGEWLVSPDGRLRIETAGTGSSSWWVIQELRRDPEDEACICWRALAAGGDDAPLFVSHAQPGRLLQVHEEGTWRTLPYAEDGRGRRRCRLPGGGLLRLASGEGEDYLLPERLFLHPATPNPFNPSTVLRCELPAEGRARLAVYDLLGRLTRVIHDGRLEAGRYDFSWRGLNERGRPTASGVYFARLEHPAGQRTIKLVLAR